MELGSISLAYSRRVILRQVGEKRVTVTYDKLHCEHHLFPEEARKSSTETRRRLFPRGRSSSTTIVCRLSGRRIRSEDSAYDDRTGCVYNVYTAI